MVTPQDFVESSVLSGRGRLFRGPNELFFYCLHLYLTVTFEKTYHTSATDRTVCGVKCSLAFPLLAHEELKTSGGQFLVGWIFRSLTAFIFLNNSHVCQTCIKRSVTRSQRVTA